jgi:hypothetical protein
MAYYKNIMAFSFKLWLFPKNYVFFLKIMAFSLKLWLFPKKKKKKSLGPLSPY